MVKRMKCMPTTMSGSVDEKAGSGVLTILFSVGCLVSIIVNQLKSGKWLVLEITLLGKVIKYQKTRTQTLSRFSTCLYFLFS